MADHPRSVSAPVGDYSDQHSEGSAPSTQYGRAEAQITKSLNARRLRQAAESDVQYLQNRLAKLKHEELRAKQEVQQLRHKADEVTANRERHQKAHSTRLELTDQVDFSKRKEAALIALNKERQAKAVWSSKQRVMVERREAVLNLRKEREVNECRVHIMKEEERDRNTKQRESIRQLQSQAKLRKERDSELRREGVRQFHEERLEREEQERIKKEKLAAQLVAQEGEMIYRLKRLHSEKQGALRLLAASVDGSRQQGDEPNHSSIRREESPSTLPPL